jgi:hypothetical protein
MNLQIIYRTMAVVLSICCAGCGSKMDSTVQGTVTIDGEIANRGTIAFYPAGGGAPAYGNIAKDGSYSLRVGQGNLRDEDASRIHSGEYVVTVVVNMAQQNGATVGEAGPPLPGPRMTADKYSSKESSPLHKTVKPGPNIMSLELEGATPPETQPTDAASPKPSDATVAPPEGSSATDHAEGAKP